MIRLVRTVAIGALASLAFLPQSARAEDVGTLLCTGSGPPEGPVYSMFDASYALYTLNITTNPDGTYVVTRREVTAAEIASICAEGFDARALPDSTVQGDYFPIAVEFYNAQRKHYFLTIDPREIADLDTGVHPGWQRTGQQFHVYVKDPTTPSGQYPLAPVCRYYGLPAYGLDTHFLSAFPDECDVVRTNWPDRWLLETADAFSAHLPNADDGACPPGTQPVYRLYNRRADVNHRYTTSLAVRTQMMAGAWIPEGYGPLGVAMCVRPD